ncbi:MAG: ring-cleaving dioxygenase [Pikeienuella sp.]
MTAIAGLHHVTAISGWPQTNADFYTGPLGQKLVKRTVNFDDPGTYHLYYGNETGAPGTIMTFFPFADAGPGRAGPGMASALAYAARPKAFEGWMDRLALASRAFDGPRERFGRRVLTLSDPDSLAVEIAETEGDAPEDGFHSVTLWLDDTDPTARLMTEVMGYETVGEERGHDGTRLRLRTKGNERGAVVDLLRREVPSIGRQGAGTIHHVAFRARDADEQRDWQERLRSVGLNVTPVIDRQYFKAIYFREPGGVLFEIATDPPGFAVDEAPEALGQALKLPAQYEPYRDRIEGALPPLELRP